MTSLEAISPRRAVRRVNHRLIEARLRSARSAAWEAGMTSQRRIETKDLRLLAAICIAAGLYGWAVFAGSFHHDGALGPRYNAPGADWMVFFAAARAYFAGNL